MFNRAQFEASFSKSIRSLAGAEKKTKELVRQLSRDVLEAHHETGDVAFINKFVSVLTPMNKRTAVLFFKAFSGHVEKDGIFGSKDKKHYEEKVEASRLFLEDPLNNMWSWAEVHVQMEAKPLDLNAFNKRMGQLLKKADEAEIPHAEVVKAILANGITVHEIMALLGEMGEQEVDEPAMM